MTRDEIPNGCERMDPPRFRGGREIFRNKYSADVLVYGDNIAITPDGSFDGSSPDSTEGEDAQTADSPSGSTTDDESKDQNTQTDGDDGNNGETIDDSDKSAETDFGPSLFGMSQIVNLIEDCLEQLCRELGSEDGKSLFLDEATIKRLLRKDLFPDCENARIRHGFFQPINIPKWPFAAVGKEVMMLGVIKPVTGPSTGGCDFYYQVLFDLIYWLRTMTPVIHPEGDLEIVTPRQSVEGCQPWNQQHFNDLGEILLQAVKFREVHLKIESVEFGPSAVGPAASGPRHKGRKDNGGDDDDDVDNDDQSSRAPSKEKTSRENSGGKMESSKKTARKAPTKSTAAPATESAPSNHNVLPQASAPALGANKLPSTAKPGPEHPNVDYKSWETKDLKQEWTKRGWKWDYATNHQQALWWRLYRADMIAAKKKDLRHGPDDVTDYRLQSITPKRMDDWATPQFVSACIDNDVCTKKELNSDDRGGLTKKAYARKKLEAKLKEKGYLFDKKGNLIEDKSGKRKRESAELGKEDGSEDDAHHEKKDGAKPESRKMLDPKSISGASKEKGKHSSLGSPYSLMKLPGTKRVAKTTATLLAAKKPVARQGPKTTASGANATTEDAAAVPPNKKQKKSTPAEERQKYDRQPINQTQEKPRRRSPRNSAEPEVVEPAVGTLPEDTLENSWIEPTREESVESEEP